MDAFFNVTPESLVTHVGVIDDGQGDRPESVRVQNLKRQLGILQSTPYPAQIKMHSCVLIIPASETQTIGPY
ncbi:hypothetical protein B0H10DRAFT_1985165 [Mycena sp. CBHHK59/15]|nr:hypothetical protein B0H10DRAFT_1985165 [Mycena sp. CBHHK59/15]